MDLVLVGEMFEFNSVLTKDVCVHLQFTTLIWGCCFDLSIISTGVGVALLMQEVAMGLEGVGCGWRRGLERETWGDMSGAADRKAAAARPPE